ncbi:MAG: hypothetical protein COT85_06530 [Chlamydiae bacterium CG10_big_fil_rev_8_21_14_0_10_42_34]|nr:MAG: hypothetical protein COT85_06530 [Chlamydiae bacterium CG10_big_fil_rev_8_21_14_0_10_42_34]
MSINPLAWRPEHSNLFEIKNDEPIYEALPRIINEFTTVFFSCNPESGKILCAHHYYKNDPESFSLNKKLFFHRSNPPELDQRILSIAIYIKTSLQATYPRCDNPLLEGKLSHMIEDPRSAIDGLSIKESLKLPKNEEEENTFIESMKQLSQETFLPDEILVNCLETSPKITKAFLDHFLFKIDNEELIRTASYITYGLYSENKNLSENDYIFSRILQACKQRGITFNSESTSIQCAIQVSIDEGLPNSLAALLEVTHISKDQITELKKTLEEFIATPDSIDSDIEVPPLEKIKECIAVLDKHLCEETTEEKSA